jgi:Amidohydrolase family
MTPHDVLWMATREAARILGRDDIGRLATGCAADVVLIDLGQLCYAGGLHDPLACVLFVGDTGQVDTTIVGGRILVSSGRLAEVNLRELASNANKAAAIMVRRSPGRIRNGRTAVLRIPMLRRSYLRDDCGNTTTYRTLVKAPTCRSINCWVADNRSDYCAKHRARGPCV